MSHSAASETPSLNQLAELVDMGSAEAVWNETRILLDAIAPQFAVSWVQHGFDSILTIFSGNHPDYKACDTGFHDLRHTTDVFLGVCRLIHGAATEGEQFEPSAISTALIATLFHDSGYIQQQHENAISGAFFADQHVQRSITFFERYMQNRNTPPDLILAGSEMIRCSNLELEIDKAQFSAPWTEKLGRILKAGDLIAQMADRLYLEKLLLLYKEFEDSLNHRYLDETDLLIQTVEFYEQVDLILKNTLPQAGRWLSASFDQRYGLAQDLYSRAMHNQRTYLLQRLKHDHFDPETALRRKRIAARVFTNPSGHAGANAPADSSPTAISPAD